MTLIDHLKNVAEHRDTPIYGGNKVPFYMVNRFFSFVTNPHCQIINEMLNYDHWNDSPAETQMALYRCTIPKAKYSYNKLFGGYVKQPPKELVTQNKSKIEHLAKLLDVSLSEAEQYYKLDGVPDIVDDSL